MRVMVFIAVNALPAAGAADEAAGAADAAATATSAAGNVGAGSTWAELRIQEGFESRSSHPTWSLRGVPFWYCISEGVSYLVLLPGFSNWAEVVSFQSFPRSGVPSFHRSRLSSPQKKIQKNSQN